MQMQPQQRSNSNTLPKKDLKQQKDMQKMVYNNRSVEGANRHGGNEKHKGGNEEDKVMYFWIKKYAFNWLKASISAFKARLRA